MFITIEDRIAIKQGDEWEYKFSVKDENNQLLNQDIFWTLEDNNKHIVIAKKISLNNGIWIIKLNKDDTKNLLGHYKLFAHKDNPGWINLEAKVFIENT